MNTDEYCRLIECAAKHGVSELVIDKFSIKFDNNNIAVKEEGAKPVSTFSDIPNHQEEIQTEIEDNLLAKAEELDLLAIEDPSRFEEILAHDDELLKRFEAELEE